MTEDRKEPQMQGVNDLALASTPHLESRRTENSTGELITAGSRVATVYELVQAILSFLPFRDLLLSQRTSKSFHHMVKTSTALRRILHLAPEHQASASYRLLPIMPDGIQFVPTSNAKLIERRGGIASCDIAISRNLQGTGSWRDMLVLQPPLITLGRTRSKFFKCGRKPGGVCIDVCVDLPVFGGRNRSPKHATDGSYLTLGKVHSWAIQAHPVAESIQDIELDCKIGLMWLWDDAPIDDAAVVDFDSEDSD